MRVGVAIGISVGGIVGIGIGVVGGIRIAVSVSVGGNRGGIGSRQFVIAGTSTRKMR